MSENIFSLDTVNNEEKAVAEILECNEESREFGLILTTEQAKAIAVARTESLRFYGRVEVGAGVVGKIIRAFRDSPYIQPDTYHETLEALVDIFYCYKNETSDFLPDGLLIDYMKEHFNGDCGGSLEALSEDALAKLIRLLRGGYDGDDEEEDEDIE